MQDLSSTVSYSPSFSYYASDEFAAAAAKVSIEIQSYNIKDHHSVELDHSVYDQDVDFEFQTSPFHGTHNSSTSRRSIIDYDVASAAENNPDNFSGAYLWSPLTSPVTSSSTPKRCRLKKFLTRSHSDGAISSTSGSKRCILKDLIMRMSHRNNGNANKTSSSAIKMKEKTASYKVGEGDNRRKSYLPYRQDMIGVFSVTRRLRH